MNKKNRGSLAIESTIVIAITLVILFSAIGLTYSYYLQARVVSQMRQIGSKMSILLTEDDYIKYDRIPITRDFIVTELAEESLKIALASQSLITDIDCSDSSYTSSDTFIWDVTYKINIPLMTIDRHVALPVRRLLGGDGTGAEDSEEGVEAPKDNRIVYLTRTGVCYHLSTCRHTRKSKIKSTVSDAEGLNKRPCKVCKPLEYLNIMDPLE